MNMVQQLTESDERGPRNETRTAVRAQLTRTFQQVSARLNGESYQFLHAWSVTPLQVSILIYLHEQPAHRSSLSELTQAFHYKMPTMTQTVHLLAKKGYLTKRINPHDARGRQLTITARGRLLLTAVQPRLDHLLNLSAFSPADEVVCLQLLSKMLIDPVNRRRVKPIRARRAVSLRRGSHPQPAPKTPPSLGGVLHS